MNPTQDSPDEPPERRSMPLWVGLVAAALVWDVIPWALSLLTRRYGLAAGYPGAWNLLGLVPVIMGNIGLYWGVLLHSTQTPGRLDWEPSKNYIFKDGLYRYSRNPMYVSELILMAGWVIFYGSIAVLIGWVAWWVAFNFYFVPQEERVMEASFGESYIEYKKQVPRWIGKSRG